MSGRVFLKIFLMTIAEIQRKDARTAKLLSAYPGKWVTLSQDKTKVLGVSSRMESALAQAHKKGEAVPHLVKVTDLPIGSFVL